MKFGLFIIAAGLATGSFAQSQPATSGGPHALELTYNWGHIGGNVSMDYLHRRGPNTFVGGIKWHNNQPVKDKMYYAYRWRGRATSLAEALGFNLGYRRTFGASANVEPFAFVNSQLSLIRFRFIAYNMQGLDTYHTTGPYYVAETNFGAGIQVRLYRDLWLSQAAGGGLWLGKPRGDGMHFYSDGVEWAFSGLIKIGLQYRI